MSTDLAVIEAALAELPAWPWPVSDKQADWLRETAAELVERVKAGAEDVRAFSEALGFGDGRTDPAASLEELVDPLQWAMSAAKDHNECPAVCERCGERLASAVCEKCHGSGCLPNPEMAYLECDECAGVGKVHVGCAEASYAELVERVKAAEAEVERHWTFRFEVIGSLLDSLGLNDDVTEAQAAVLLDGCDCNGEEGTMHLIWHIRQKMAAIARVRELAESVPKTIAFNPSDAAYLSGQVDFAESVLDALNHTDGISPQQATSEEVTRFTSANSGKVDDTTPRARAESATEPILRPTDQRQEWRCHETITLRDEGHVICRCVWSLGHDGDHSDGLGTTWTAPTNQRAMGGFVDPSKPYFVGDGVETLIPPTDRPGL